MARSSLIQRFRVHGQLIGHKFHAEIGGGILGHRFGVNGSFLGHKFLILPDNTEGFPGDAVSDTQSGDAGVFAAIIASSASVFGASLPFATEFSDDIESFDVIRTGFPDALTHRFSVIGSVLGHKFLSIGDVIPHKFLVLPDTQLTSSDSAVTTTAGPLSDSSSEVTDTEGRAGLSIGQVSSPGSDNFDYVITGVPQFLSHRFRSIGDPIIHRFGVNGDPFGHRFLIPYIVDATGDDLVSTLGFNLPFGDGLSSTSGLNVPLGDELVKSIGLNLPFGGDIHPISSFDSSPPFGDDNSILFIVAGKLEHSVNLDHIDVPPAIGTGAELWSKFDIDHIDWEDELGHKFFQVVSTEDEFWHSINLDHIDVPPAIGTGAELWSVFDIDHIDWEDILGHLFEVGIRTRDILPHLFLVPISTVDSFQHRFNVKPFRLKTRFLTRPDRSLVDTKVHKKLEYEPIKTRTTRQR